MREQIEDVLKEIIMDDFENSEDYIEDGLVDSFDIIKILTKLEDIFHIKFDMETLGRNSFKNLDAICQLVNLELKKL